MKLWLLNCNIKDISPKILLETALLCEQFWLWNLRYRVICNNFHHLIYSVGTFSAGSSIDSQRVDISTHVVLEYDVTDLVECLGWSGLELTIDLTTDQQGGGWAALAGCHREVWWQQGGLRSLWLLGTLWLTMKTCWKNTILCQNWLPELGLAKPSVKNQSMLDYNVFLS